MSSAIEEWHMSDEYWWDDTNMGKPKCLEETLYQYHFVYHKSHVNCPKIESEPMQ